jgi:hypothetical protein
MTLFLFLDQTKLLSISNIACTWLDITVADRFHYIFLPTNLIGHQRFFHIHLITLLFLEKILLLSLIFIFASRTHKVATCPFWIWILSIFFRTSRGLSPTMAISNQPHPWQHFIPSTHMVAWNTDYLANNHILSRYACDFSFFLNLYFVSDISFTNTVQTSRDCSHISDTWLQNSRAVIWPMNILYKLPLGFKCILMITYFSCNLLIIHRCHCALARDALNLNLILFFFFCRS